MSIQLRIALVIVGLLVYAAPVHATLYWATGWEDCYAPQPSPTPDTNGGLAAPVGNPVIVTTGLDTTPGTNRCAREYAAVSSATVYDRWIAGISGGVTSLRVGTRRKLTGCAAGLNKTILSFANPSATGHYTEGCLVVARYASTVLGVPYCTLNVYYGSATQTVCSGSTNDGKRCTTVADCDSINPDEAQCAATSMATSDALPGGSYFSATLLQDNSTGVVTCGLYSGADGTVYSSGSEPRTVGYCAGGANANEPCTVASECPASSCNVDDVFAITEVRSGVVSASTGALTVTEAGSIGYSGTVIPNWYVEALDPSGQDQTAGETNWDRLSGAVHGCADGAEWACLDDGSEPDLGTSALTNNAAARPTIGVQFANPPTPAASPSPKAVIISAIAQDAEASASNSATVRLDLLDDGGTWYTSGAAFDYEGFTGNGGVSGPYYVVPPLVRETKQSGAAWNVAGLNDLKAALYKTAGSANDARVSSLTAQVLYQTADPIVPDVIPDRDQDGEDTVCFVGDSTWDNLDFQNALVALLHEPDNFYFYTRGAARIGDVEGEWPSLLEGASGTFLGITVRRGTGGKTCDVVINQGALLNNMMGGGVADPALNATFSGINQGSYCEDLGGPDQGNVCACDPKLNNWSSRWTATPAPDITPAAGYCINNGDFGDRCSPLASVGIGTGCACSTNADCTRSNDGLTGVCSGGFCVASAFPNCAVNAASNVRQNFCMPGCVNVPGCTSGVCVRSFGVTAIADAMDRIDAMTAVRPTPAATPPAGGKPIAIDVASQPGVGLGCWSSTKPASGMFRHLIRQRSKTAGTPYLDLWARTYQYCLVQAGSDTCTVYGACTDTENVTKCYRDAVHGTYKWQALVAAPLIAECLTNRVEGETVTHDGVCTGSVCTRGLHGDDCTTAADCDTLSCDLQAQS